MFNLIEELKKYQPFDQKESEDLDKILNFLQTDKNCFDRSNKKRHITAGALVCDMKGNVLLNHHKASGMWFQFGGHSDGEENSLNVAKREVMEEAGITNFKLASNTIFDVAVLPVPYNAKKNEPEHWHYDINFLFIVDNHNFSLSNESLEIKWVTINQAFELINKDDLAMKRMLTKYKNFIDNYNKKQKIKK